MSRYTALASGNTSSRSRRGRRRVAVAAIAASSAALLAACSSGSSSSSSTAAGSSSASAAGGASSYFKGKTITLIAPDAPGGSYDSYARLFAPYLGQELGATINVSNVAGGGTVAGSNQAMAASPDGLTIGMIAVGGDIAGKIENQPSLTDDMGKVTWLGQPAVVPNALITQPGSSVTSFAAMLKSPSPVTILDIRNGIGDTLSRVIFGAFGIPHQVETGFEATSALKQGFLAKDGQVIFQAMSTLYPLLSGNQGKALLTTGPITSAAYQKVLAGVPAVETEVKALSGSKAAAVNEAIQLSDLADDFAAPAGLPAAAVSALRTAFSNAAAIPALQAQAAKEKLPLAWTNGTTLAGQVATAVANASTIAPYVKS
jgi:tripartite-type tricarboxylate transporter receptor subunit TctC